MHRAYGARRGVAALLPGALLILAGCGGSGAGAGSGNVELNGTWSGEWLNAASGSLFAHPSAGTITVTFSEVGGTVSGDIALSPDICDDVAKGDSSGTISGNVIVDTLEFTYDTPVSSREQPASVTEIAFTATLGDPMEGTYDATPCSAAGWNGTFLLTPN